MEGLGRAAVWLLLSLLTLGTHGQSGPVKYTAAVGGQVLLHCGTSRLPSHNERVQWTVTKGGADFTVVTRDENGAVNKGVTDPQNRFSLLSDASLLITALQHGDARQYSCNQKHVADLEVVRERVSVPEGNRLFLNCSVPPPAEGSTVLWTHMVAGGSKEIIKVTKVTLKYNGNKPATTLNYHQFPDGSLSINKVQPVEAGQFYCDGQHVADVEVLTGPAHYTVSEGRTVLLPCNISQPPIPSERVQWTFSKSGSNSETILTRDEKGTEKKPGQDHRFSLLFPPTDLTLVIRAVQPTDSGQYLCNTEHAAHLQVIKATPGSEDSSSVSASLFHTVYTSFIACGLAAMISAVIVTEIKSRQRGESQREPGELP
ncbi:roundabout homolog 3 isoform X2 [Amia ocellicauda]|uniref:roundabout homolog 3 isoform X2 n=1 Tax=Amia ocellicauda TaxID=2972642 RepID=UPI00346473A9